MSEKISLGACPLCGGDVFEKEKNYACVNAKWKKNEETDQWENSGCNYGIRKVSLEKFGKAEVTAEDVKELLANGKFVATLISKEQKPYKKEVVVDEQWGVKVDFNSNPGREDKEVKENKPEAPAPKNEDIGEPEFQAPVDDSADEEIPF